MASEPKGPTQGAGAEPSQTSALETATPEASGMFSPPSGPTQGAAPEESPSGAFEDEDSTRPKILVEIDKPTQEMKVFVDGVERYTWQVSTGLQGYDTPSGKYTARSMNEIWYSEQWDNAPMPHAIFFTKKGHAVHGTNELKHLGKPASHGCVRLAPENARTLFALVKENGLENTEIVLNGDTPKSAAKVASAGARKQEARQGKKNTKTVRKGGRPPREFADRRFERPSMRRGWARFFLSPPPRYYAPPPGQRFLLPGY